MMMVMMMVTVMLLVLFDRLIASNKINGDDENYAVLLTALLSCKTADRNFNDPRCFSADRSTRCRLS